MTTSIPACSIFFLREEKAFESEQLAVFLSLEENDFVSECKRRRFSKLQRSLLYSTLKNKVGEMIMQGKQN